MHEDEKKIVFFNNYYCITNYQNFSSLNKTTVICFCRSAQVGSTGLCSA